MLLAIFYWDSNLVKVSVGNTMTLWGFGGGCCFGEGLG